MQMLESLMNLINVLNNLSLYKLFHRLKTVFFIKKCFILQLVILAHTLLVIDGTLATS